MTGNISGKIVGLHPVIERDFLVIPWLADGI